MYRSFTDRVLGGVCGGLAAPLPINAWGVRLLFIVLTAATLGAAGLLYLMLWLAVPQASPARRPEGGAVWSVLTLALAMGVLAGWGARLYGLTQAPSGTDLYFPVLALVLSLIFLFRQFGRGHA